MPATANATVRVVIEFEYTSSSAGRQAPADPYADAVALASARAALAVERQGPRHSSRLRDGRVVSITVERVA